MQIMKKLSTFKVDWIDVVLIKTSVFAATLLFAKIYEPILSFEWYWYLIAAIIVSVRPVNNSFKWFKTGFSK